MTWVPTDGGKGLISSIDQKYDFKVAMSSRGSSIHGDQTRRGLSFKLDDMQIGTCATLSTLLATHLPLVWYLRLLRVSRLKHNIPNPNANHNTN